jgi:hypothetical protein
VSQKCDKFLIFEGRPCVRENNSVVHFRHDDSMTTGAFLVALFAVVMAGPVGKEKHDLRVSPFLLVFHLTSFVELHFSSP